MLMFNMNIELKKKNDFNNYIIIYNNITWHNIHLC